MDDQKYSRLAKKSQDFVKQLQSIVKHDVNEAFLFTRVPVTLGKCILPAPGQATQNYFSAAM